MRRVGGRERREVNFERIEVECTMTVRGNVVDERDA